MHSVDYKALNLEDLARTSDVTQVALGIGLSQENPDFFGGWVSAHAHMLLYVHA